MTDLEVKKKKKKSNSSDKREKIGFLEDKTLLYFRRASDQLREGFEDEDDKAAFLDNVFKETVKEEIKLARNQSVSRILEEMISVSAKCHVEAFLPGFTENYHLICTDRFASHVTQALINKCAQILTEDASPSSTSTEVEPSKSASTFVTELFNVTYGNMREFAFDTYASHVIRSLLLLLGGCDVRDASLRSSLSQRNHDKQQQHQQRSTSDAVLCLDAALKAKYQPLLEQFCEKCLSLGLADMVKSDVTSPVLQALLKALKSHKSALADAACERLMTECRPFDASKVGATEVPPPLSDPAFCRLVEELIAALTKTRLLSVFKHHLRGRLAAMCHSPSANFVLQRFLRSVRTPKLFGLVADEIFGNFEPFVTSPYRATLVVVAEMCVEFGSYQREFQEALMSALGCLTPPERRGKLALLAANFQSHDGLFADKADNAPVQVEVSLHGSLLLQRLFTFASPDPVFNGFMALPPSQLSAFACHPCGCHVFDAIFTSAYVDDVKLNKFVSRLRSSLVTLATSKHGSRVIDSLWKRCSTKNKVEVADALTKQLGRVSSDKFGKFIARNLQLDNFSLRRDQWIKNLGATTDGKSTVTNGQGVKRKRDGEWC